MKKSIILSVLFAASLTMAADKKAAKVAKGDAAKGKKPYETFCVACHGAKGAGDGAAAAALNPKPRNFTDKAYMSKRTDELLAKIISEGGAANGLSPLMASWKASLKPNEINDIVAYIRTFAK